MDPTFGPDLALMSVPPRHSTEHRSSHMDVINSPLSTPASPSHAHLSVQTPRCPPQSQPAHQPFPGGRKSHSPSWESHLLPGDIRRTFHLPDSPDLSGPALGTIASLPPQHPVTLICMFISVSSFSSCVGSSSLCPHFNPTCRVTKEEHQHVHTQSYGSFCPFLALPAPLSLCAERAVTSTFLQTLLSLRSPRLAANFAILPHLSVARFYNVFSVPLLRKGWRVFQYSPWVLKLYLLGICKHHENCYANELFQLLS